jgi:hypothetical protein
MLMVFVNICTVKFWGDILHQNWVNKKRFRDRMCPVIRVDVRICVSKYIYTYIYYIQSYTISYVEENKVRELATVCLPWQYWTKALVWFDDVDISAFHSCVVIDLWQSLSEWHLLMFACVLVCRRENVRRMKWHVTCSFL